MHQLNVTPLAAKAMLVKLTTRRVTLNARDKMAEEYLQNELGDTAFVVNKKLFRDPGNPINKIMSVSSEVYTYHRAHTLAYMDKGPRILPNTQYMDYTTGMRERINKVDSMMAVHMPQYYTYVNLDIQQRTQADMGKTKPVNYVAPNVGEYPTREQFERGLGFDLRFMPLPEEKHFLYDISDSDRDSFNTLMSEIERNATVETIRKMLTPLEHLVEKLNKPIGTEGATFREASVENIIEGIEIARKLNISEDPEIARLASELSATMSNYIGSNVLRESPIVRQQAAQKLDYIARQMGALYGA